MSIERQLFEDPYNFYAQNRATGQLKFFYLNEDYDSEGFWGIFLYNQALDIFKNVISTSKNFSVLKNENKKSIYDQHLLNRDLDDHARLRKLTLKFFTVSSIDTFYPAIEVIVDRQLTSILKSSDIDLIHSFVKGIPIFVILKLLGIQTDRSNEIVAWIDAILIDSLLLDDNSKTKRQIAVDNFILFVSDIVKSEVNYENDSLIHFLVVACRNEKLNHEELIAYLMFLILAGHETTIDLIGNSINILLQKKEIVSELLFNPTLISLFIEEVLRFESPVQRTTFRVLNDDTTISGVNLRKNDQVRIFIGSINRDESIFNDPQIFKLDRNPNPHMAFGYGPHNCIGQHLARFEARVAILKILPFLTKFNLSQDKPQWKYSNFSRGLEYLIVNNSN
jgi:pimeloyl-[acyl-carrier protein] synthase